MYWAASGTASAVTNANTISSLRIRSVAGRLQALKLLDLGIGLRGVAALTIDARQSEVRLRGQRAVFFDRKHREPRPLRRYLVALERRRLAERVENIRHARRQSAGAFQLAPGLLHFALLQ